jgi:hypothetical protein
MRGRDLLAFEYIDGAAAAASARATRDSLLRDASRQVNEEEFRAPAGPGD